MRNVRWYILVFFAACAAVLASCDEPVPYGTAELLVSGSTGSKSITPGPSAAVAKVLFGGTRSDGTGLAGQTVDLSTGKGEVSGITVGTWTFTATGLNAAGDVVTEKAERGGVVIASGKSTPVAFTLRYLTEGSGTYRLTVCWPEGLSFKGVRADLGGATVEGTVSGSSAVFSGSLEVGDYGVGVDLTNPSGTVIGFPNLEMVNVYKGLESEGTVTLDGADFMRAAAPVIAVSAGTGGQQVTVSCATSGAVIHYTTDGSTPSASSTTYSAPFTLTSTATVRAIAAKDGMVDSTVAVSEVAVSQVAAPVIDDSLGKIGGKVVTIECATSGAVIHYTTDGTEPTSSSTRYGGAVTLTSTKTVKAIAVKSGMADSSVAAKSVAVSQVATPSISPASCTFSGTQSVTVNCTTSGAEIHYTTDGTEPTTLSATYSGAFTVSATTTVKAIAVENWMANSGVACATYTLKAYAVGDAGPAGGVVFYDKGSYSDGWRYLEAAPSDEPGTFVWGGYYNNLGIKDTAIGTGKANTEEIVKAYGPTEPYYNRTDYAAKVCADKTLTYNNITYDDWFLPSYYELESMIKQEKQESKIGGFEQNARYWSSSECKGSLTYGYYNVNTMAFDADSVIYGYATKDRFEHVRAIRAF